MDSLLSRRRFLAAFGAVAAWLGLGAPRARAEPWAISPQTDEPDLGDAIDLSIRHTAHHGLNDFLLPTFEVEALNQRADLRRAVFRRAVAMVGSREFRPQDFGRLDQIGFPKRNRGTWRVIAVLDPMDTIAYLALALQITPKLERNRVDVEDGVVHSYRYRPDRRAGTIFDPRFTYASFLEHARLRAGERHLRVGCDIANFYGNVSPAAVRRALSDAAVADAPADFIVALLEFWSESGVSGLPVGSDASAILAEAVLSGIDEELRAAGIDYVRYMDDFRLIAANRAMAKRQLAVLESILADHGLALNPDKTVILRPGVVEGEELAQGAGSQSGQPSQPNQGGNTQTNPSHQPYGGANIQNLMHPNGSSQTPAPSTTPKSPAATPYRVNEIPRDFVPPTATELMAMRAMKAKPDPAVFLAGAGFTRSQLRDALYVAICTGQSDFVDKIPVILQRHPEFSRFATLALSYGAGSLSAASRSMIRSYGAAAVLDDKTPTFVKLDLLRLLGEDGYLDRNGLLAFARASAPRGLAFRAGLDALRNSGGIPKSVAGRYESADRSARRALAIAIPDCTHADRTDDPFVEVLSQA
jgi:Reverse transcriptase (RNA-dependent DNA polymerase)